MAEDTGQERTEQATQRRREEVRKRGQVARSTEVNSAVILLAGFAVLMVFGGYMLSGFEDVMRGVFGSVTTFETSATSVHGLFMSMVYRFFRLMLPMFAIMAVAGILVNVLQVGFLFTAEPITPKLEKINPASGLKRIFSQRSLESLVRDIIKTVVVLWIGYASVRGLFGDIMTMGDHTVGDILSFTGHTVFSIAMNILIGYAILAVLDYAFQRYDFEQSIRMTRQEIREELKQTEGDPMLRARIRTVQREIARRRMMEEVPKADVVVTNPTEIAVALQYGADMAAPVVVAKGRNIIAERIRERAVEAGVPIVENVTLAQALYKAVEIGRAIPENLYTAVAEVLAYIYRLKGHTV